MSATVAKEFEWSIRALAQPPEIQLSLFPPFVAKADELALDFDEWRGRFFESENAGGLSPEQARAVSALDRHIESMSGPLNERLWTDDALRHAPEWNCVRKLALKLLIAMNWPLDPPPPNRAIYVGPDESST